MVQKEFEKILRSVIHAYREPKVQELLIRCEGTTLKNYPDTRFCYIRDSCESVRKNLSIMRDLTTLPDSGIPRDICEIVNGTEFEAEVLKVIHNATPICVLINKCQDPKVNIADATQLWLKLELPTSEYNDLIKKRIASAVWPVGYAANYLHHKYRGLLLNENQIQIAESFMHERLDLQGIQDLQNFEANRESHNYLAENCEGPISFWILIEHKYQSLAALALEILMIPASTALIESFFSQWTFVHNIYRNRLEESTSAELVDIYHFLNTTGPKYRKKSKKKYEDVSKFIKP